MRIRISLIIAFSLSIPALFAQTVREEVTYITNNQQLPDEAWQSELRHRPNWQHFLAEHGTWYVEFNEGNAKPHRAFGKPITTVGNTVEERAWNFIADELSAFGVNASQLELQSVSPAAKYTYVHFRQKHQGLEVLFGRVLVKLDNAARVVAFGTDVYTGLTLEMAPGIGTADAQNSAAQGLAGVTSESVEPALSILPVPVWRGVEAHLVYEVTVNTFTDMPGRYHCLVDAHNGALLYRQNEVVRHEARPPGSAQVDLTGNVYEEHPYIPAVVMPLPHALVNVNGTDFNTDANGYLDTGVQGPVNATISLEGTWSTVRTNGVTPSFTISLADGSNAVSFDADANIRERSAYFHVNIIHDHQKALLPSFSGMDFSLPTNVDVSGTCNAFYDGASINFYMEGNNCQSYAQIGEVVYHEYGHGINDNFYQANGSSFQNGAMNEGYADVWGLSVTEDPILAEGSSLNNSTDYIRRYDQDPKVYPIDLVGEVHSDGEIIAGAWWDTYVLLGNDMALTMALFAEAFPGLQADQPNGNEGVAFRDVLLDLLAADDDDADITNGTPHGNAIVEAFAIHGITLISNAELVHTPIDASASAQPITVDATLILTFPFTQYLESVVMKYRVNDDPIWNTVLMTPLGGGDYSGEIPAQPNGTVIPYYVGVQDIFQQISSVLPVGAHLADPNIPYFILVGYVLKKTEDADNFNELGNWETGLPTDNNSSGTWSLEDPVPSYNDDGIIVQTNEQHTPGGELCYLTGNAAVGEGIGVNDVDGGHTTLRSDPIDLSSYINPTFSYWRWYTNDPPGGANPGADWWHVQITNDGVNWQFVENTKTSDKSWRRFAFRVQDYVTPNSTVQIRMIASDSTHLGQNLDGGSLIEAAIDDIQLWDEGAVGLEEVGTIQLTNVYPDPANDHVTVALVVNDAQNVRLQVMDATGRVVLEQRVQGSTGLVRERIDTQQLSQGSYVLRAVGDGVRSELRFNVVR